ncbi:hypothetical protein [Mesorhizobium sp. M1396]|uniref:hypothetical protein n=1 Tax=Mesorhizobium sp. M1396 TaxID=2957095 RepID=UPI00333518D0
MTVERPAWPAATDKMGIELLAFWVEEQLPLLKEEIDAADAEFDEDTLFLLHVGELDALAHGFEGKELGRWRNVAEILRTGNATDGFMSAVADLIEHGGFTNRAKLASHRALHIYNEKRLVEKVLRIEFGQRTTEKKRIHMATRIAAFLEGVEIADVQKAVKTFKDPRRRPLLEMRLRVMTGPRA